jgi:hypothetical protein
VKIAQTDLFPGINRARYGDGPPTRRLFIRRFLDAAAGDKRADETARERAHKIILRWADMEAKGELGQRKETSLQGEFLAEVFGQALGYTLFSEGLGQWDIEPSFTLPGGQSDAAIGLFGHGRKPSVRAVVELKGPKANLDRDRFNGRTPVQQCWDYLNALPECPWGIVCNFVSFRLYHHTKGNRAFELFTLEELKNPDRFAEFYCIFHRYGLLEGVLGQAPRADGLLAESENRQREVGGELYGTYHHNRVRLVECLRAAPHHKSLETALRIAQKILDRVVFVAFCEDRGLLPKNSIREACGHIGAFARASNPRWRNFCELFRSIDEGNPAFSIPPFNGGLFRQDPEVDDLQLGDEWTEFFKTIGSYDFRDEVNLDVLGHLFELSINDLERIRIGGLYDQETPPSPDEPRMGKSPERKRGGVYYTPEVLTEFLARQTIQETVSARFDALPASHWRTGEDIEAAERNPGWADHWKARLRILENLKIVDPACGSGAFLIQAYDVMEELYRSVIHNLCRHEGSDPELLLDTVPELILTRNLYGVDLSKEAVEITQLALWIQSAREGWTLADLSHNIVHGNSLVDDPAVDLAAMNWKERFPEVFARENSGFDCVIGNPPWERMKLQEREFFDLAAPHVAGAVNAATRRRLIREMETGDPELHARYLQAKQAAERMLDYARNSGKYPLTGKGDVNTYAVFAELARTIVSPMGRIGLLVPSGIATDHTTREFFRDVVDSQSLIALYDFENKKKLFADVDGRFKFCTLRMGGSATKSESADFAFFCHSMEDLERGKGRHISLTPKDFKLLNPNTRTCPIFRRRRDAELTKSVYRHVPVLIDRGRKAGGNPWGIRFFTMFHQTNDAELFTTAPQLEEMGFKRKDGAWRKGKRTFLPLYEAKMVQAYDHRAASVRVETGNWMRQGQTVETTAAEHQSPEFLVEPRWWVDGEHVAKALGDRARPAYLCYKDVTSPTNRRTMIAAMIPHAGVLNSAPLMLADPDLPDRFMCCLLANLNSVALDFVVRQKVGGLHLNFFIVEQLPIFDPGFYDMRCPWSRAQKLKAWVPDRVLRLTCTSNDMKPLAKAASFRAGVHRWRDDERADIQAELDAAYFLLYHVERDDVEYILKSFGPPADDAPALPGPATPRDLILAHYDRLREESKP